MLSDYLCFPTSLSSSFHVLVHTMTYLYSLINVHNIQLRCVTCLWELHCPSTVTTLTSGTSRVVEVLYLAPKRPGRSKYFQIFRWAFTCPACRLIVYGYGWVGVYARCSIDWYIETTYVQRYSLEPSFSELKP